MPFLTTICFMILSAFYYISIPIVEDLFIKARTVMTLNDLIHVLNWPLMAMKL